MPPLGHDAGGYEYGLSGDRDPGALQQHAEENDQVPVLADQGEDMVYGLQGLPILLLTRQTVRAKGGGLPLFTELPTKRVLGNPVACLMNPQLLRRKP